MNKSRLLPIAALAAAMFAAPAFAQSSPATLRVDSGSAMISTGGEFTTAASGTQVPGGSRLMLTEGSRATLVYPNGCTKSFTSAGVYNVIGSCVAGVAVNTGTATGVDWGGFGVVAGVTAAAAAGLASMDDVPYVAPPPVSR